MSKKTVSQPLELGGRYIFIQRKEPDITGPSPIKVSGRGMMHAVDSPPVSISRESQNSTDRSKIEHGWGERLIRGWGEGWFTAPQRVGAKIAQLIGAQPDEVIVCDSTSVNLFKLVVAALQAKSGRQKIVTDDLNFPTDVYILQGVRNPED